MDRFVTRLSNVALPRLSLSLQEATLLYFLLGRDEVFRDSEIAADLASILLPENIVSPTADARLEALLGSAFDPTFDDPITAVIRFSAKDAPYLKERRHGGEVSFEEHPDGRLTMIITTSGRDYLLPWILSFGAGAEILAPPELRERTRDELIRAAARYEAKP